MASDSRDEAGALNVGTLGSFAFSIGSARQMFDDEDLQMLVYTGTGQGMDGDEASAPGGVLDAAHTGFLGWSNSGPKATEGPEGYSQPLQPPTSCEDSYIRESDNQSIRSSAPSVFDRNSGGMMSHQQQSIGQLPVLHGTHSNDYESLPVREGSVDDGSHGSAGVKKRARKTDSKNKRLPGTMRGPFHPSGPCLLTGGSTCPSQATCIL